MRHGGHQTFTVREGWLYKGLQLLYEDPKVFFNKAELANALGVGANMALSIEHWLQATKLVTKNPRKEANQKSRKYELTTTAEVIWKNDKYMTYDETWWILHINVVQNPEHAATWEWFFNAFPEKKFEKAQLVSRIMRKEKALSKKTPTLNTIERDVSCFLNTYAVAIPRDVKDPEEDYGSPFQELHLMDHLRASGNYELHRKPRYFLPEIVLHAICGGETIHSNREEKDFTLSGISKQWSGPLQTLCLNSEGLFEQLVSMEDECMDYNYTVRNLAGDRQIVFNNPGAKSLLENMYRRL